MRTSSLLACCFLAGACGGAGAETRAETSTESLLHESETRLRAIYDRGEFRAGGFRADWLPDSTEYTVLEPVPDGNGTTRVQYDAASGERSVLEAPRNDLPGRSGNRSPNGRSILVSVRGNLVVRELDSDREIRLTNSPADSAISNDRAVWSLDGKWIAFVQSDASAVRLRSSLVPGDPTYPEVRQTRFARVGESIPTLRVCVVDAGGLERRRLEHPERHVPQAGGVPGGDRRRAAAAIAPHGRPLHAGVD